MPAGAGSVPHSHPNEQWVYILEGTMDSTIEGKRQLVRPGQLIYIPANAVHHATATEDRDVVFFQGYFARPARHPHIVAAAGPAAGVHCGPPGSARTVAVVGFDIGGSAIGPCRPGWFDLLACSVQMPANPVRRQRTRLTCD